MSNPIETFSERFLKYLRAVLIYLSVFCMNRVCMTYIRVAFSGGECHVWMCDCRLMSLHTDNLHYTRRLTNGQMGRQRCIRVAATFHFKHDLPVVPRHLPPTSPLLMHRCHSRAQASLAALTPSQPNNQATAEAAAAPAPHYSKGLSPPIFPIFGVRPPYFLSASVYPISQDAPKPPLNFLVMNDHWPSHWQRGSWCHIITVSTFRLNYQITPVLKRPGRLTGSRQRKHKNLKREGLLGHRQTSSEIRFVLFLKRPHITANEKPGNKLISLVEKPETLINNDRKHLASHWYPIFPF